MYVHFQGPNCRHTHVHLQWYIYILNIIKPCIFIYIFFHIHLSLHHIYIYTRVCVYIWSFSCDFVILFPSLGSMPLTNPSLPDLWGDSGWFICLGIAPCRLGAMGRDVLDDFPCQNHPKPFEQCSKPWLVDDYRGLHYPIYWGLQ